MEDKNGRFRKSQQPNKSREEEIENIKRAKILASLKSAQNQTKSKYPRGER